MLTNIIFDVDGTLVDSVDLHAMAWQEALQEFGHTEAFETVRAQIGKGGDQLLPMFLSEEELALNEEKISKFRAALFQEKYMEKIRGFHAVRPLFERLLQDGKRIALASSALGKELQFYKEKADIVDLVDTETSQDDADQSKPHPDIFEAALDRLGNPKLEETIVIGDTPYDIDAAGRAGLRTIAVRCGGFPEATLSGAVAIFDGPADLLARYEEWAA